MVKDCSDSILRCITEGDFAAWRTQQGARVVCHRGRYWEAQPAGFFNGLHLMARMAAAETTRPTPFCWGYRATLRMEESARANGAMPVHLLGDVQNYTFENISSRRRNKIRNCRKQAEIVEFLDPQPLLEGGYEVLVSARRRTGYGKIPPVEAYRREMAGYFGSRRGLVLAARSEGRLSGYIAAFAVEGTAYVQSVELASEALSTNIGTTLVFELVQACRRSGTIDEIVYGLHSREDQPLCHYKEQMGFPAVQVPARVWFIPLAARLIRSLRPHAFYRLTGHD
ncbi:hypothetical protein DESUT3_34790 [Desulfuromonas versatilis]|uniref:N-acetyltransferase domain-containing protein n=1 Tax=Desulfuromonas versatilis TaxID=2802975 RepID=A0ABM8HWT8_9BACT|nr:GNAT family N-acetyltransferase [Desulfuromonas versatilis]BCR06410.1 hypothetical protein DESUT3_34790 [Desulfuromonas versatilis]